MLKVSVIHTVYINNAKRSRCARNFLPINYNYAMLVFLLKEDGVKDSTNEALDLHTYKHILLYLRFFEVVTVTHRCSSIYN